jgi:uncharacterized NAD-dependent epimerase/dehydratase family protein
LLVKLPHYATKLQIEEIHRDSRLNTLKEEYHVLVLPTDVSSVKMEMLNGEELSEEKYNELIRQIEETYGSSFGDKG